MTRPQWARRDLRLAVQIGAAAFAAALTLGVLVTAIVLAAGGAL